MLTVVQSNRWETLVGVLLDRLPALDPFAPPTLIVPSAVLGQRALIAIAEARGIAAGLTPMGMVEFAARLIRDSGATAVGPAMVRAALASELAEGVPELATYLAGPAPEMRRVQLAAHLADLFGEYALTRPPWLDDWTHGRHAIGANAELAAWQRPLWQRASKRLLRAIPDARLALAGPTHIAPGPPVFVLGISEAPPAWLQLLYNVAKVRDVLVLTLSPCGDYWGEVMEAPGTDADRLLSWGRPAWAAQTGLLSLAEGNIDNEFAAPTNAASANETALSLLVHELATRSRDDRRAAAPGVTVLACPSALRELEAVVDDILLALRSEPRLDVTDIVIAIAGVDTESQLALLPAVIAERVDPTQDGRSGLPLHWFGGSARGLGRAGELADALMALPGSKFDRNAMTRVLLHPILHAHFAEHDPSEWATWIESGGMVLGADAADLQDTYLASESRFHWDQGVLRLALGAFVDGTAPIDVGAATLCPIRIAGDSVSSAAVFATLVRSLIADARRLATLVAPMTEWARVLATYLRYYLGHPADPETARDVEAVMAVVGALVPAVDTRPLNFAELRARLQDEWGRVSVDEGARTGIAIGPLRAVRGLAARRWYVLGLSEHRFPSSTRAIALDAREPTAFDVTTRDRDRHQLLDSILSTREQLTLSYTARNEATGEAIEPSSTLRDLAAALAPHWCDAGRDPLAQLTRPVAFARWLEPNDASPEQAAVMARSAMRDQQRALSRDEIKQLAALPHSTGPTPRTIGVSVSQLRAFLEAPAQGWARAVLRLRETDEVTLPPTEPYDVSPLDQANLLRDALHMLLRNDASDPHVAHALSRSRNRAMDYPAGLFAATAIAYDITLLQQWLERLGVRGELQQDQLPADDPLRIAVESPTGPMDIHVTGALLPHLVPHGTIVVRRKAPDVEGRNRAALDHVVRCASGRLRDPARYRVLLPDKDMTGDLAPWDVAEAKAYLGTLVHDLFTGQHMAALTAVNAESWRNKGTYSINHRPGAALGWGPLTRAEDIEIPPDVDAIMRRRWVPLWEHLGLPIPGAAQPPMTIQVARSQDESAGNGLSLDDDA